MDFKAVLLDIDGTLVDSNEFHVIAWEHAFRENGFDIKADAIRKHIGKGGDNLIPDLLPQSSEKERQAIAAAHDQCFKQRFLSKVRAFPHAADFVKKLHDKGLKVVLASSAKQDEVDHYVELLGVKEMLTGATSADDVERSKPHGDIFSEALKKIKPLEAQDARVIGDTPYDVIAAKKCGVRTLALLTGGFSKEELMSAGADEVFESIASLIPEI